MEIIDKKIVLDFHGPFKFSGEKSLFCSPFAKNAGVYIWVIKDELHNVNYVDYIGETTNFSKRHREHFRHMMGLDYRILDIELAKQGVLKVIWNGMWRDKSDKATDNTLNIYNELYARVIEHILHYDIYFAPVDIDTQLRKHIEGSIGWNMRKNHKEANKFYPDDNHIGTRKEKYGFKLIINLPEDIAGIDREQEL